MRVFAFVCLMGLGIVGCGGGSGSSAPPETADGAGESQASAEPQPASGEAEPQTFEEQAALGGKLYGENCASCHGASGQGDKAPRVVGLSEGALPLDPPPNAKFRKSQFKTAADVAKFVVENMPPGKGGSLPEPHYWAILAFDLKANGVTLPHKLDASNAASVVIHP